METKKLFELIENLGEGLFDSLHIIDISDGNNETFRIYHSSGYCFDVQREYIEDISSFVEEFGNVNDGEYYYSFQSDQFEGFKELSVERALKILTIKY